MILNIATLNTITAVWLPTSSATVRRKNIKVAIDIFPTKDLT